MLDRIVNDPAFGARSRERLAATNRNCDPRRRRRTSLTASPVIQVLTKGIGELELARHRRVSLDGGYAQLERAVKELGPEKVMERATASNLRGRGGAGFPTGRKWSFLPNNGPCRATSCAIATRRSRDVQRSHAARRDAASDHRRDLIGGYAIGCTHAYIYIRGEFKRLRDHARAALGQARAAGYIGKGICGSITMNSRSIAAPARTSAARRPDC